MNLNHANDNDTMRPLWVIMNMVLDQAARRQKARLIS